MQTQSRKSNRSKKATQFSLFDELDNDTTAFNACWKTDEILKLQQGMLLLALEEIRDHRKSLAMRKEAWDWLFSDKDLPFCARLCAQNSELDIDRLRYLIRRLVTDIPHH